MGGCEPPDQAFGFLLTITAGLATMLGTAFIPALKWGNQDKVTSGALGFAAGVMLYVSFVDVLGAEATNFFKTHYKGTGCFDEGHDHGHAHEHDHGHGHGSEAHDHSRRLHGSDGEPLEVRIWVAFFFFFGIFIASMMDHVMALIPGMGHSHGADSARDLEIQLNTRDADGSDQRSTQVAPKPAASEAAHAHGHSNGDAGTGGAGHEIHSHSSSLERVSMVAFLALTVHNVPEGLATFLGASRGSMTVPFAIAMHNIPEGAAIAVPGYQVHGSWVKALRATFIAGLAQPVGALIGWLIIIIMGVEQLPEFFYGATYSATAGIMVGVSILELIPEALQSAPARFVGMSCFLGFFVMELSIVLLGYVEA